MLTSEPSATSSTTLDAGRADRLRVIESRNSTWIFDEVALEFCRVMHGAPTDTPVAWRPYDRLIIQPESDAFLVFLDAAGSRVLRARRSEASSDADVTQEFSIAELRKLTHS
jgi:hypothetical protein